MISKEITEKKLLDVFYLMKLDKVVNKAPKEAVIEIFEQKDSEEHNRFVKNGVLKIFMSAKSYEERVKYVAANFAMKSAKKDLGKRFSKFGFLCVILLFVYAFVNIALTMLSKMISYMLGIMLALIAFLIISGFILAFRNSREKVVMDFKIKTKTIGLSYSSEKIRKYSKSSFNERMLYVIVIVIIVLISLINLISTFYP